MVGKISIMVKVNSNKIKDSKQEISVASLLLRNDSAGNSCRIVQ